MKTIARLPLARLDADESHVEAFKALGHLSRIHVFFFLVRAGREVSVGEIQAADVAKPMKGLPDPARDQRGPEGGAICLLFRQARHGVL